MLICSDYSKGFLIIAVPADGVQWFFYVSNHACIYVTLLAIWLYLQCCRFFVWRVDVILEWIVTTPQETEELLDILTQLLSRGLMWYEVI